jgi:diacylglycerol O-acyltransferase
MPERLPLSEEDVAILHLESPTVAGHTCKLVLVEEGEVGFGDFFSSFSQRIEAVPELRRKLVEENGSFFWVEDEDFALEDHLIEVAGGQALSVDELDRFTTEAFSERLDRERPLWRMDFVHLQEGGNALVWRIHHSLADGSTAMRFAKELLWDRSPGEDGGQSAPVRPATTSSAEVEKREKHRRMNLAGLFERELSRSHGPSPFDGQIGHERAIAFAAVSLSSLHNSAKKLADATLNDAVLSVVAASFRHWMELEHNDVIGDVRARVPVSLHRDGENVGNRDSFFSVPLHLDEPNSVERLKLIRAETWERKVGHDAEDLDELTKALGRVSGRLQHLIENAEANPRAFAVSISNVKGPREPVTVLGAPVQTVYSVAEIGEHHALRIAVISTGDRLGFSFCSDPDLVKDVSEMAEGVELEAARLDQLARQA